MIKKELTKEEITKRAIELTKSYTSKELAERVVELEQKIEIQFKEKEKNNTNPISETASHLIASKDHIEWAKKTIEPFFGISVPMVDSKMGESLINIIDKLNSHIDYLSNYESIYYKMKELFSK